MQIQSIAHDLTGKFVRVRGISRRGKNRLQNGNVFLIKKAHANGPLGMERIQGPFLFAWSEDSFFWFAERNDPHIRIEEVVNPHEVES